jgi:hypothetical protein
MLMEVAMMGTLLVSLVALVIAILGCALVAPTNERGRPAV